MLLRSFIQKKYVPYIQWGSSWVPLSISLFITHHATASFLITLHFST